MKRIIVYVIISIIVVLAAVIQGLNMLGDKLLDAVIDSLTDIPEVSIKDENESESSTRVTEVNDNIKTEQVEETEQEEAVKTDNRAEQVKIDVSVTEKSEDVFMKSGTKEDTVINDPDSDHITSENVPESKVEKKCIVEGDIKESKANIPDKTENMDNVNQGHNEIQGSNEIEKSKDKEIEIQKHAFTPEAIQTIKNRVTAEDRIKAAVLVLRKLTPSDIVLLKSMLEDGISVEEKEQAKQIVYSRFSDEEIQQIKEIYRKYIQ